MRGVRSSQRGAGLIAYVAIGLVMFFAILIFAALFPALTMALIFVLVGILMIVLFRAHPYLVWAGVAFVLIGALFGFDAALSAVSLSIFTGHGV